MIEAGLNVVRLNFSHGTHDDHSSVVNFVREIDKELGTNTALLADLQGPKLRVGVMQDNGVMLEAGKQIIITTEEQIGTATHIYTNYKEFASDVKTVRTV